MSSCFQLVTVASLMVHSLFGCCIHGAHGETAADGAHEHGEHCHHDHAGASGPRAVDGDHQRALPEAAEGNSACGEWGHQDAAHACMHAKCAWHAPEIWGAGWMDHVATAAIMLPAVDTHRSCRIDDVLWRCPSSYATFHALPVRTHLAVSVLLI